MYTIKFDEKVTAIIGLWKKSNPNLYKKFVKILISIAENPRHGIGHPEPLIGGEDVLYSRRISAHDRIIYRIYDKEIYVIVIDVGGHYKDK